MGKLKRICLLGLISFMAISKAEFEIIPATREEADLIDDRLGDFNNLHAPFTQNPNPILQNYIMKDNGTIIAGIKAELYHWNILYVAAFFVDERYRGQGLGSALLNKVESEAKAAGSTLAHLDTFDFQAKDFYLKHGYEIFGVLDDCPPGHKRYYLKKKL
jgi:GNAT superfamily N-acetyltransferase